MTLAWAFSSASLIQWEECCLREFIRLYIRHVSFFQTKKAQSDQPWGLLITNAKHQGQSFDHLRIHHLYPLQLRSPQGPSNISHAAPTVSFKVGYCTKHSFEKLNGQEGPVTLPLKLSICSCLIAISLCKTHCNFALPLGDHVECLLSLSCCVAADHLSNFSKQHNHMSYHLLYLLFLGQSSIRSRTSGLNCIACSSQACQKYVGILTQSVC